MAVLCYSYSLWPQVCVYFPVHVFLYTLVVEDCDLVHTYNISPERTALTYSTSMFTLDLENHIYDVQRELTPVAANWKSIGIALRLKPESLNNIDIRHSGDPRACLSWMVMEWLMRNYNVEKFGEPNWQRLVEAVGEPAGGANMAVARRVARRHKAGGM